MELKIENILRSAGYNHRYQYTLLGLALAFWCFNDLMSVSVAYLEKPPLVDVNDKLTGSTLTRVPLIYDYCDKERFDYKIVQTSNHSWTNEFDLNCDKKMTGLIGSFAFLGALVGSIGFQIFSNSIGRKNTVFYFGVLFSLAVTLSTFMKSIYWLYFFQVLIQFFAYNVTLCSFIQAQENVEPEQRSVYGAVIHAFFSVSAIMFILLYWWTQNWRTVFLIGAICAFVSVIIYYFAAYESPKLQLSDGNIDGFLSTVEKIAETNSKTAELQANKDYSDLKNHENEDNDNEIAAVYKGKQSESTLDRYFSLIYYDSQRLNFLIMCFIWFTTSGTYYALSIYIKNLPGNIYVNGIIIYAAEIVAYCFTGWTANLEGVGRKYTFVGFMLLSLVSFIPLTFMDSESSTFLYLSFVAKIGVSGVYSVMFFYSGEVFPTPIRANALGLNSVSGRVASIIFPILIEFINQKIFLVFLGLNVVEILIVFKLPETRGEPALTEIPERVTRKEVA